MKAGIGTNFLLKVDHAKRLEAIWSKCGEAWNRTEIFEALLAYESGTKQEVLATQVGRVLSKGDISFAGGGVGFEEYKSIVGFDRWADIENRYQPENRPAI